ncbi:FtsX-like permease family protein [Ornithinimicrobium sp. Y1847]|uniref:FtsX-like permease family protein n=1 Tax=Ornithinimicrobium sp. Y1847 TaxID=3405419 RepID=UPI003B66EB00
MAFRQFAADPWVSAALGLLIALVSLLATAAPRALEDVNGRQLTSDVQSLSAAARDVTGSWQTTVEPLMMDDRAHEDPWQPFIEGAERIRAQQPEPLRSALQPAQFVARMSTAQGQTPAVESGYYLATATIYADPYLEDHVRLVDGEWPGRSLNPAEIVVLAEAAEKLQWEIGDRIGDNLRISGTYEPIDPADPRWQHLDNATRMGVIADPNLGDEALVSAFLNPTNRGTLGNPAATRVTAWFPVDPSAISADRVDTAELRRQLTAMIAQQHVLVTRDNPALGPQEGDQMPLFTSELTRTLDQIVRQQRATASLLAVVAAGPLGVALAVTALAAALIVHRRRPGLALALARGASLRQIRGLVALEGLAIGVPLAVLGHLLARWIYPGSTRWWEWAITLAIALTPAIALAASVDDASLLHERRDLSGRSRSRWRWIVEIAVLGLAALATWRLLDRGQRGDSGADSGIDLLAAATPVLLALAACVLALRLYPLPLALLTSTLRGGRRLTPFLGAARALRDPAGGLVPALAVVLGTTIALVSAVLLTTVTEGAKEAAWQQNGADVRVRGPWFTDDLVQRVEAVDGVAAVARISDAGGTQELRIDGERAAVRVLLVDPSLGEVIPPDAPGGGPPQALYAAGDSVPVVPGGRSPAVTGEGTLGNNRMPVTVLEHLAELPGYQTPGNWLLMDATRWADRGRTVPVAQMALISVDAGADATEVGEAIQEVIGSGVVTTVQEELDRFSSSPVTIGMTRAFLGATLLTGLLTVLAVVVVQLMGAAARARLLAVLRTLGLAPGQTRALTAWELGPLLVTSLIVGSVLGLLVPWVLVRALDLTGLTGGRQQPSLSLDPLVIGTVLGAVILTVLLAITVSAWLAGRANLAQALRVGEER